jgi:hypothetical protein
VPAQVTLPNVATVATFADGNARSMPRARNSSIHDCARHRYAAPSNAASTSPRARASILSLASRLGRAPLLGCGRWLVRDARRRARARPAVAPAREDGSPLLPRQNFPLNLPPNRRLCSTVGGRIVEGWTTHCCVASAARLRAATMTNLARSSLALVLPALFGAAKSCALVKFSMICPRWSPGRQPTTIVLLITAISWHAHPGRRQCRSSSNDVFLPLKSYADLPPSGRISARDSRNGIYGM